MRSRVKKMSINSIEQVVDVISDDSITNTDMPEPVNLDEVRIVAVCDV